MKKNLILLLLLFPAFWFTYQQQGFKQYQENYWTSNFVCEWQCIMLIWATDQYDMINLNWNLNWQWVLGYWFLVWQQIIPWEIIQINWNWQINEDFVFSKSQNFKQIPPNSQVVVIMEGNLQWNIKPSIDILWLGQKISMLLKDFWDMETLTPYSINLRYWIKLLWTSILTYWYRIFILVAIYILVFSKEREKKKFQKIFYLWIWIFLFIWIRNLITYTRIVDQWLKNFTHQIIENKTFFDLWDYIAITDKIRKKLNLDDKNISCKIKIHSFQDWPFRFHRENLYLKPCIWVMTWSEADYTLYYKKPIQQEDKDKKILIDFNWSYLLQNK